MNIAAQIVSTLLEGEGDVTPGDVWKSALPDIPQEWEIRPWPQGAPSSGGWGAVIFRRQKVYHWGPSTAESCHYPPLAVMRQKITQAHARHPYRLGEDFLTWLLDNGIIDRSGMWIAESEVTPSDVWKQTLAHDWQVKDTGYRGQWLLYLRGESIASFHPGDIDPEQLLDGVRRVTQEHPCPGPKHAIAWLMRWGFLDSHGEWKGTYRSPKQESEENPADFMASFSKHWHGQITHEPEGWLRVQWFRGLEKVGDWNEIATGGAEEWRTWMENYFNWLDTKLPFDSLVSGEEEDPVGHWYNDAERLGFLAQYRKTPNGRKLPPPPNPSTEFEFE